MMAGSAEVETMGSPLEARHTELRAATVRRVIDHLVCERQSLRRQKAPAFVLEANRLAIVYWQQSLSRLLPGECRPHVGDAH